MSRAVETDIQTIFTDAGCEGTLHAVALASGAEVAVRADEPVVMASVFKALVALEFYSQVAEGRLDPGSQVRVDPKNATPGPTGLSLFRSPATVALGDLAYLMMALSDNAATDILASTVGLEQVNGRAAACGCSETVIRSDLRSLLDEVAGELGSSSYRELLEAQSGRAGPDALARSTDQGRLEALAALDPARASRTTARDMTRFLAAVWRDAGAPPAACAALREVMGQQVTRRFEVAVPDGGRLAAKSGGLFGRIRNEIGVVTDRDGQPYAVAVFTRAHRPFAGTAEINAAIGRTARLAVEFLRRA